MLIYRVDVYCVASLQAVMEIKHGRIAMLTVLGYFVQVGYDPRVLSIVPG